MKDNTQLTRAKLPVPGCGTFRVISDESELPRGSFFTTLPIPLKTGDLALFAINGAMYIGRWYPNLGGVDWIRMPGIWVPIVGDAVVRTVGRIIPVETTFTNMETSYATQKDIQH